MAKPESFYQRLTRIFRSAPAIQRRVKGYDYRSFYNTQTQQGALGFRPPSPMGFGRENSPFSSMGESGLLDRMARYSDFASMEYAPEIASALDVYSHEVVGGDDRGKSFHVFSKNPEIKKALDDLFYDVMNVEFNLGPWTRNLCKFGDFFLFNEVIPDIGIINVAPIPVSELEREEGFDPVDPFAVRYKWLTRGNQYLENWQVTHMRILGNDAFLPYGHSVLESSRRIWRTLQMMEDAMLVYRVIRAPDRRVFYIDVGNIDPKDVQSYMEAAKTALRSSTMTEHAHGRGDQRHNPLPVHKDTPIPLLDGRTLSIEQLAKEFDEGKNNWVYSIQDKTLETVPGNVVWCGKNYTATKLVKVWLDDDTYVTTAPEHPFVLIDGSSLRADELTPGLSLMPLYREMKYKVRDIEHLEVPGEDVYCMTVVGPNGEDDRHNFSAISFSKDGTMSKSAIFLKNSIDEDYFIAVRGTESGTKIDTLAGGTNATATEDIEYFQKKLFAALKVPKPYLNYDENTGAKATLAQEDVRFSRTIATLQKIVIAELNKLAMIHLFSKGFDGEDLVNFELKLSNPSTIALQQRLEIWQTKTDVAGAIKETALVDETWIKKNILELTDEDIALSNQRRIEDKIREVELEAIEAQERVEQQARTVDEFDPTNYKMTGEEVPKFAAPDEEAGTSLIDGSESAEDLLNKIRSYDEDGDPYFVDYDPKKAPLKANSKSTWADKKYNRSRRMGTGGRDNLANPDFSGMLSSKNRSLKDLYDKRFLDNPFSEEITIHTNKKPALTGEMKSIFDKLRPMIGRNDKISKILAEEISFDDDRVENSMSVLSESLEDSKILLENISIIETPEQETQDTDSDFDEFISKDTTDE